MPEQGTKEITIQRARTDKREEKPDLVAAEFPLSLILNEQEFITLLCTPEKMEYLAVGFLRSEGVIKEKDDILSVRYESVKGSVIIKTRKQDSLAEKLYGKRTVTSGCGKGTIFFNVLDSLTSKPATHAVPISVAEILALSRLVQGRGEIFKQTGGVHGVALCSAKDIIIFSEDIGRHNALDKVLGEALMEEVPVEDKILVSSGRISSEILLKAAKLQIALIVSRSAPTSLSVELAEKLGITVVGFARGGRINIYSHPWRIS